MKRGRKPRYPLIIDETENNGVITTVYDFYGAGNLEDIIHWTMDIAPEARITTYATTIYIESCNLNEGKTNKHITVKTERKSNRQANNHISLQTYYFENRKEDLK